MKVFCYFSFNILIFLFVFSDLKNGLKSLILIHEKLREIKRNEMMEKNFFDILKSINKNFICFFVLIKDY